ncbi:MAG: DUF4180 domain-containing protein [Bacteroidales bacterium]|nr:DUF4180 domain-containing protein [Bacteroidales bacterium]NMD03308.1 DUF4180 domain-containing protein [Bacteroidales bacterium]
MKYHTTDNNIKIAEITDKNIRIATPDDALELFANLDEPSCNRIVVRESNLNNDFFDLKTKIAGEILQKFSNYKVKLAIIGDFTKYKSRSLQDFIRESNRGRTVFFADDLDSALSKLGKL